MLRGWISIDVGGLMLFFEIGERFSNLIGDGFINRREDLYVRCGV